jgi:hypothetical protein
VMCGVFSLNVDASIYLSSLFVCYISQTDQLEKMTGNGLL